MPLSRRVAETRPTNDGQYTFRNLPPGDYFMAAVTDVEPGEWMDPKFLQQLTTASIPLSLEEGANKTQNLRLAGSR